MDIILAAILDHVHQLIGAAEYFIHGELGGGKREHANTEGHRPAVFIHMLQQLALHIGHHNRGGLLIGLRQQDNELVTAHPGNEISLAQVHLYVGGDGAQDCVTFCMPKGVVDVFEVININEREREGSLIARGTINFHLRHLVEKPGVQRSSEEICTGKLLFALQGSVQPDHENRQQKESKPGGGVPHIGEQIGCSVTGPKIYYDPDTRTKDRKYQSKSFTDCPGNQSDGEQVKQRERKFHPG